MRFDKSQRVHSKTHYTVQAHFSMTFCCALVLQMLSSSRGDDGRKRTYAVLGGIALFVFIWWSTTPTPQPCEPAAPTASASPAAVSSDVNAMTDADRAKCYRWLETDLQECEYVIKWLQQNSADEDARTGLVPTAAQLAEREIVAAKHLYCVIPSSAAAAANAASNPAIPLSTGQRLFQDAALFRHTFFPFDSSSFATAAAASSGKSPALALATCKTCEPCSNNCPKAPPKRAAAAPVATKVEKRVISFGLYGADPKYVNGALRNAELTPSVFPGWTMRVYHDNTVPRESLDKLAAMGYVVCMCYVAKDMRCISQAGSDACGFGLYVCICSFRVELREQAHEAGAGIAGMFWRFLVADDETVDRYIVRDTDSRLNEREARAVDAWIASGKKYHILRDHPSHSQATVSGGIWGGVYDPTLQIASKMKKHSNKNDYIQDVSNTQSSTHPFLFPNSLHRLPACASCACRCTFWVM